ncbi:Transposon Tf2-9 polyprotein [Labeo rohita]|uniref:Gypsy retrotransposon integrase-like protein 1 n=1 Tax=Labeo rohita TaxID=84645 RepID=A0ABQ8LHP4_LABRO|nr:Transposon Tf2-9 polyprotein [Labeo rohita]
MDPAKETPIRFAVELQGAMLGRHQEEFSAARYAVEGLSAQVTELTNQLQSLHSEPTVKPSRFHSEPRINNPPCYSGQPTQCRAFLTQCEVVFSLQPATYAADRAKVAFVISLLSGRARDWGAAVWEMEAVFCEHFSLFKEEMIKVFDRSVFGQEASRLLSSLRQGKRSAADYAIEFRTLAATCEWNEPALAARFLEGLTEEVREEILSRDMPSSLDQMVELAIRLDKCFEGRRHARVPVLTLQPISTSSSSAAPRTDPEPMQLGSLCISGAERQCRIHHRLCLYSNSPRTTFPALLFFEGSTRSCSALIDSGAEGNFIDEDWALQHGVPLQELVDPLPVFALDGSVLSKILRVTIPVSLTISGNHQETITFLVFRSPLTPVVLGHPWLTQHNPQINWVKGTILSWDLSCHVKCLVSAAPAVSSVSVSQEELDDLSGVPREYHDLRAVFSRSRAASLPPHRPYDCSIDLIPGSTPPRGKLYSLSNPEREALKKYLSDSLAAGTIVPSSSPAGAGFFFVAKKDGSLRPCIDYRGLNDITIKNRYPLPLMSSAFEILQGAKIFTKLDLRNAYHLVRIKEGDEWKTAFNTPLGHFEYRVLPFGLANAPSVFQALVNDVLRDMLNVFVFVYLDVILIFSPSVSDHVQHVCRVLQRLLENCLFVKAEKCVFHVKSVTFSGHVVSADGISMDLAKVRAVIDWPIPDSRTALQRFLGFANFYRRFIRNFSQVAAPLTALTSTQTRFVWSESAQEAFDKLKKLFSSAPILITPDTTRQFIVEVDASSVGVGAVLSQRSPLDNRVHPCAFFSHRLSPAERNYDVGNRELLAIRLALGEWRHWLEGAALPFLVWTDHRNLAYIRSAKRLNARQARWALFFDRFNFTISHRPGSKNTKPDALSRQFESPDDPPPLESILPKGRMVGAVVWGIEQQVKRALSHVTIPCGCPEGKLFVPESVRSAVLRWSHASWLAVHPGVRGTLTSVRQRFWWPDIVRVVRRYVASCPVCAQSKSSNSPPAGLLRPLPIPSRPWSHIALDFVSGLPSSAGNTVILTVIDRFSKAAHFIPLPKLPSAKETALTVFDHVFKIHGLPSDIVSNRGFHPQTNGQAERVNQILGRLLRTLAAHNPDSWCENLRWAEYAYNSLPSSATGLSPFHACLGYQPPVFSSQEVEASVPSVQALISRCRRTWRKVRQALCQTRKRTRRAANRHRSRAPRYVCGQRVWLSTRNLPLQPPSRKLAPKFIGPFSIVKVLNPVAVRLRLPNYLRRVHPVFHVSCIKPVNRPPSRPSPPSPPVIVENPSVFKVKKLLAVRPRGRGFQYLVDWEGYGPEERSWIPARDILDRSLINDFLRSRQSSALGVPGGAPRCLLSQSGFALIATAPDPHYALITLSISTFILFCAFGNSPFPGRPPLAHSYRLRNPPLLRCRSLRAPADSETFCSCIFLFCATEVEVDGRQLVLILLLSLPRTNKDFCCFSRPSPLGPSLFSCLLSQSGFALIATAPDPHYALITLSISTFILFCTFSESPFPGRPPLAHSYRLRNPPLLRCRSLRAPADSETFRSCIFLLCATEVEVDGRQLVLILLLPRTNKDFCCFSRPSPLGPSLFS